MSDLNVIHVMDLPPGDYNLLNGVAVPRFPPSPTLDAAERELSDLMQEFITESRLMHVPDDTEYMRAIYQASAEVTEVRECLEILNGLRCAKDHAWPETNLYL